MTHLVPSLELFILFSSPAPAIPSAYSLGCRRRWFVLLQMVGSFCAVLLWVPLAAYSHGHGMLAGAATYLLATTAAITVPMPLDPDPEDEDDDSTMVSRRPTRTDSTRTTSSGVSGTRWIDPGGATAPV